MAFATGIAQAIGDFAPQPEQNLGDMLGITWSRGPDLPQGFQDSNGGIIGNTLITACGFCSGRDNDKKPGKYPRGFLKKVWALDLANEAGGWKDLPEFPGAARQGLLAAPIGDSLYFWGGFSYSEPYCYDDGYRLTRKGDHWVWDPLPPLPWPTCGGMCCSIGSKIFVCGGADYDAEAFYTQSDRKRGNPRMGARLIVFDTAHPDAGWRRRADCPGTPRWVAAMAAVNGKIYLIGGATGSPYCTVVDNWLYDPDTDAWTRLRDLPIASGNFPNGQIVFRDLYIVLGGGYQYGQVANPDGTTRDPYGTPRRFQDKGDYSNDMFVYDTRTGLFARADAMPLNNNMSMMVVHGNEVYTIGGETGGAVVEGEFYGHHPELLLKGKIRLK
jgi:N-acetylneuraminic acid mutarotase